MRSAGCRVRWKELSSKVSKCLQSARGPDGISAGSLTIAGFSAAAGRSTEFKHFFTTYVFLALLKMAKDQCNL